MRGSPGWWIFPPHHRRRLSWCSQVSLHNTSHSVEQRTNTRCDILVSTHDWVATLFCRHIVVMFLSKPRENWLAVQVSRFSRDESCMVRFMAVTSNSSIIEYCKCTNTACNRHLKPVCMQTFFYIFYNYYRYVCIFRCIKVVNVVRDRCLPFDLFMVAV